MCDSLVILPNRSASGAMLFAKNSDRERNEPQALEMTPGAQHAAGTTLKLTYAAIPQVTRTHACLLSRPFWMWGAEMGANEHGVVIGNEAMHSVVAPQEAPALTGMDLVRLGLQRAGCAAEALHVMTTLLERHGQGGNCGHLHPFYYHNGFIIADGEEAYVLETVGRSWAFERVKDRRVLSNAYSIGRNYDGVSADLGRQAHASGWTDADGRFDFADRMIDLERDEVSFGRGRCARGSLLLDRFAKRIDVQQMMRVLRDHGEEGERPGWTPQMTLRRSICMHAAEGARRSQTTASMVTQWGSAGAVHWATASAAPCLSIFKPVIFGVDLPRQGGALSDQFDAGHRWWRHELWHRSALVDYACHAAAITAERDALEARFIGTISHAIDNNVSHDTLSSLVASCWREADDVEASWFATIHAHPPSASLREAYAQSWRDHDRLADVPTAS